MSRCANHSQLSVIGDTENHFFGVFVGESLGGSLRRPASRKNFVDVAPPQQAPTNRVDCHQSQLPMSANEETQHEN